MPSLRQAKSTSNRQTQAINHPKEGIAKNAIMKHSQPLKAKRNRRRPEDHPINLKAFSRGLDVFLIVIILFEAS